MKVFSGMRAAVVAAVALVLALPASAAAPTVSIAVKPTISSATDTIELFGRVTTGRPGETVRIEASECNGYGWRPMDLAETTSLGAWTSASAPNVTTKFRARWLKAISNVVTVRVRPFILLDTNHHGRLLVIVRANDMFKRAILERKAGTRWVRVRLVKLAGGFQGSVADIRPNLARGTRIRVKLTQAQVGRCYLPTTSEPATMS